MRSRSLAHGMKDSAGVPGWSKDSGRHKNSVLLTFTAHPLANKTANSNSSDYLRLLGITLIATVTVSSSLLFVKSLGDIMVLVNTSLHVSQGSATCLLLIGILRCFADGAVDTLPSSIGPLSTAVSWSAGRATSQPNFSGIYR